LEINENNSPDRQDQETENIKLEVPSNTVNMIHARWLSAAHDAHRWG
jgi:hypothetical protein